MDRRRSPFNDVAFKIEFGQTHRLPFFSHVSFSKDFVVNLKHYRLFILLLGFAFLGGAAASPTEAANPNSSWAWAKPLNQKPGSLLYTTNVAAKTQSASRSSNRSYSTRQNYRAPSRGTSLRLFRRFRR